MIKEKHERVRLYRPGGGESDYLQLPVRETEPGLG